MKCCQMQVDCVLMNASHWVITVRKIMSENKVLNE